MATSNTVVAVVTGALLAHGMTRSAFAQTVEPPAAPPAEPTPEASAADSEVIEIDDTAPAESASSVHLSLDDLARRSRTQVCS